MSNWIQGAIKHPGAFTKKAEKAGKSVASYAAQVTRPGSGATTQTKRQANLYETLQGFHKKGETKSDGKNLLPTYMKGRV